MDLDQKRSVFRNECENNVLCLSLSLFSIHIYKYIHLYKFIYIYINSCEFLHFISFILLGSQSVLILSLDQRGSFSLESAINSNLPCNNQYIYIHHYSYMQRIFRFRYIIQFFSKLRPVQRVSGRSLADSEPSDANIGGRTERKEKHTLRACENACIECFLKTMRM